MGDSPHSPPFFFIIITRGSGKGATGNPPHLNLFTNIKPVTPYIDMLEKKKISHM